MRIKVRETKAVHEYWMPKVWLFKAFSGFQSIPLDPVQYGKIIECIHVVRMPSITQLKPTDRLRVLWRGNVIIDYPVTNLEFKYKRYKQTLVGGEPNCRTDVAPIVNPEDPAYTSMYTFDTYSSFTTQLPPDDLPPIKERIARTVRSPSITFWFDFPLYVYPNDQLLIDTPQTFVQSETAFNTWSVEIRGYLEIP